MFLGVPDESEVCDESVEVLCGNMNGWMDGRRCAGRGISVFIFISWVFCGEEGEEVEDKLKGRGLQV